MASDLHITAELIAAVRRGDLEPYTLAQIVFDHVLALCTTCRREIEKAFGEDREAGGFQAGGDRIEERLIEAGQSPEEIETLRTKAPEDLARLLKLPRERHQGRIDRAHTRFRGVYFAELLLDQARSCLPADAEGAQHFAALARRVAAWSPAGEEIQVLALAHEANGLRAAGHLRAATRCFAETRRTLRTHAATDLATYAEVDWLEGILHRDRRSFAESEKLLLRSLTFYSVLGDEQSGARSLLSLGELRRDEGKGNEAADCAQKALGILDRFDAPRLELSARFNLALYQAEAGEYEEAHEALVALTTLLAKYPDAWTMLRAGWLEGDILKGLGRNREAEATYRAVRDGFAREHRGYDAALVSLDLAELYLRAGRIEDLKQVSEEMSLLFSAADVDREALAALLLFQEAVRLETVTVAGIADLRTYLEQRSQSLALKFRKPS